MKNTCKVLLTTQCASKDFGWGEDMSDIMASRLTRGQGPFKMTSHCHAFALYLIGENISNPTTVLEHPSWDDFDRELDQGYDIVGFQLESMFIPRIASMLKRVRKKCPHTKIVIGGYGVMTLDSPIPGDKNGDAIYIKNNADYLCREEGVRFMRQLLDDTPVDREITQYHLPVAGFLKANFPFPVILTALGCRTGCDFCVTSAFFRRKKIYVAEPGQVYRYIKHYQRRLGFKDILVMLYDEDIFLDPDYVRELGQLLSSDRETRGVRWLGFGSVRSLSQFNPEELRATGCGVLWIGVESFLGSANGSKVQYGKREGRDIHDLFASIHQQGIMTIGSMMLGIDVHTRQNIKEDIDKFVALKPTFYQIAPLVPCPGTSLYERLLKEERLYDTCTWDSGHLWQDNFLKYKNFAKGEIKEFFDYAHQQIRDNIGPPPLQAIEIALDSFQVFKNGSGKHSDFLQRSSRQMATVCFHWLRSVKLYHKSEKVRQRAYMLEKRYLKEIGRAPFFSGIVSRYIAAKIKKRMEQTACSVPDPVPRWTYYNTFDKRVWVKKGRRSSKPAPYDDRGFMFFNSGGKYNRFIHAFMMGLVKKLF